MVVEKLQCQGANPTIWVLVIEQSIQMSRLLESVSKSKAVIAVQLINRLIHDIICRNYNGEDPKNCCFISVIGYNHNVEELCSGWLKDLDENPLRLETVLRKMPDGNGSMLDKEIKIPIWIEAKSEGDDSARELALGEAKKVLLDWFNKNQAKSTLPIIFNIMSSDNAPKSDFIEVDEKWNCRNNKFLQMDIYINDDIVLGDLIDLPFKLYIDGGGPGIYDDETYRRFYEFNTLDADVQKLKGNVSLNFKVLE